MEKNHEVTDGVRHTCRNPNHIQEPIMNDHPSLPAYGTYAPSSSDLPPNHLTPQAQRNLRELKKLIDMHFEHRSRVLVVRIDLRYIKEIAAHVPHHLAHDHLEQLLGDRRIHPSVFNHLLAYAWGLEWGEQEGGIHYHLLLLFDGAHRRDDVGIGLDVGELWKLITGGWGEFYVSNFDKWKFDRDGTLGIGMIHRNDVTKRTNLINHVAAYLIKRSPHAVMEPPQSFSGGFRLFGKSRMPKPIDPNKPRRGRPPLLH